jgi:hypothetical protein
VKKSDWGLGLFLTEHARQGDLVAGMQTNSCQFISFYANPPPITEYIGEVILEPTVLSREYVPWLLQPCRFLNIYTYIYAVPSQRTDEETISSHWALIFLLIVRTLAMIRDISTMLDQKQLIVFQWVSAVFRPKER